MPARQTIAWFGAFVAVVLLAGLAAGVMVERHYLGRPRGSQPGDRMPGMAGGAGQMRHPAMRLGQRLGDDLQLTAEQRRALDQILARRRESIERTRTEMLARMTREQSDLRAEIRAILDAKQQTKFDQMTMNVPGLGMRGHGRGGRGAMGEQR